MTSRSPVPHCVFRVAAGPRIGFGHLMRVQALASALPSALASTLPRTIGGPIGRTPVVSLRGGALATAAAQALGCRLVTARADLLAGADVLIVDDPSASHAAAWIHAAHRAGIATVAVHDAGVGGRGTDLIVDGSLAARIPGRHTRELTGPSFCILHSRVVRFRKKPRGDRRHRRPVVLVSLGGGRQVRRHAVRLVAAIARCCPGVSIRVAAGMTGGPLPTLPSGRWIVRSGGLGPTLHDADVAVVAGGVTLYEACAIGTPVVATGVVPAQRVAIDAFIRAGAAIDGGSVGLAPEAAARQVAGAVALLVDNPGARRALAVAGRRLVDGAGAGRVARHIACLVADRSKVRLKPDTTSRSEVRLKPDATSRSSVPGQRGHHG